MVTHQYQRCIIELVSGIDVRTLGNDFLAHLEITSSTCFAQPPEAFTEVERIIFLELSGLNHLLFFLKAGFYVSFLQERHDGRYNNGL